MRVVLVCQSMYEGILRVVPKGVEVVHLHEKSTFQTLLWHKSSNSGAQVAVIDASNLAHNNK